jgi:hypothetical protein
MCVAKEQYLPKYVFKKYSIMFGELPRFLEAFFVKISISSKLSCKIIQIYNFFKLK